MPGCTIEVADRDVGIAVPEGAMVRFVASDPRVTALDGRLYPSSVEAGRAANALLAAAKADSGRQARGSSRDTPELDPPGAGRHSRPPIQPEIIRSADRLHCLLPEWWGLWRRAERATPFQSPGWLLAWWTSFHPGDLFAVALRRHGELIAFAPLYRETGALGRRLLPIGISVSDSLDVLVDPAWREEVGPLLLDVLARERGSWDSLHLEELPHFAEALALALPDGYEADDAPQSAHPVLALDGRGPPPLRRVEKAWRRARRRGEVAITEPAEHEVPAFVEDLFRLHAAAWEARGEPGVLADEAIRSFHRAAIPNLHAAGVARLLRLEIEGHTAAILYGFLHRGRASAYLSGYDPAYAFESPGAILLDTFIRRAAAVGAHEIDFLRGRERYKYDWGAVDRWTTRRVISSAVSSSP